MKSKRIKRKFPFVPFQIQSQPLFVYKLKVNYIEYCLAIEILFRITKFWSTTEAKDTTTTP